MLQFVLSRSQKSQKAPIKDNWRLFLLPNQIAKKLMLSGGAHPFQFLTENLNPACTDINVVMISRV